MQIEKFISLYSLLWKLRKIQWNNFAKVVEELLKLIDKNICLKDK